MFTRSVRKAAVAVESYAPAHEVTVLERDKTDKKIQLHEGSLQFSISADVETRPSVRRNQDAVG